MLTVTKCLISQPLQIAHHHAADESFPPDDNTATRTIKPRN